MSGLKLGAALATIEDPSTGAAPTWGQIKGCAQAAEAFGFDTVWIADELLWEQADPPAASGWWEGVAHMAAIAAVTETVEVGSWVLSALHRNPALTAKAVETLDDISGGRFIFGFGAGHSGRQGEAFGYPPDRVVGRYVEALDIVVGLIREGTSTYAGTYHSTVNLEHRPKGPQWPNVPLMLGGHGPRTIGIAVEHADIWSAYATSSSEPSAFTDMMNLVDSSCEKAGRDPATLGRSVGIEVWPSDLGLPAPAMASNPLTKSTEECAATLREFAEMGFDRVELFLPSNDPQAIEAFAPLIQAAKGA